jgi:sugar phosphate isomerase/epimerase
MVWVGPFARGAGPFESARQLPRCAARVPDMTGVKRLGIVSVAFGTECTYPEAGRRAAELGFDHIDIGLDRLVGEEPELALPIGDRIGSTPRTGCTVRPPRKCTWEEGVAFLRQQPGIRVEPGPASLLDTAESIRAMCEEVPGLRLTLDTGWSVYCGFDPLEVADLVGHLQLRQAKPGTPQMHIDEEGDVDFPAVFAGFAAIGYQGLFSVEYFNLPDLKLPLEDPVGWSVDLMHRVRPMITA